MDDAGAVLVIAVLAAFVVVAFWRLILTVLLVGVLTVVFAGMFGIAIEVSRFTGG